MEIGHILVTDREGEQHKLDAVEGWRVMEIIRDHAEALENKALHVEALCGGSCSCATCHVYVAEEWAEKLVPPLDEEVDMLDEAYEVEDNSRLSCQIIWKPELDGLEVTLAPEFE
jgi:2Fe-2S ferredoxin